MQYGVECDTYKRIQKEKKKGEHCSKSIDYGVIGYVVLMILTSRVSLINESSPFGLALLMALVLYKDKKTVILATAGGMVGYITMLNSLQGGSVYLIYTLSLGAAHFIIKGFNRRAKVIFLFTLLIMEGVLFNVLLNGYSYTVGLIDGILNIIVILPILYIFKYGINCFEELNTNHLFNNEEIISMAIVIAIAVSGLGGFSIFNISIRNIIALTLVVSIAYINGSSVGAAIGIATGLIMGISDNNIYIFIGVLGSCGFITGLFREPGKLMAILSYLISFTLLKFYSGANNEFVLMEALISAGILMIIPNKLYTAMTFELDFEKKQQLINDNHLAKVKEVFTLRLKGFNDILNSMAGILNGFMDNDKLLLKGKSSGLVENLADRVCGNCDMRHLCWKRELHLTYTAFSELIENYYNKSSEVPKEIERKCIKKGALCREAESIVNSYIVNEMWKSRLAEGRKILAGQISGMSGTIGEIVHDFDREVVFNHEVEKLLIKALARSGVKYSDIFCFSDKKGRLNIKLSMEECEGAQLCVKKVLPIINQCVNKTMCLGEEGCSIHGNSKRCTVLYEETPKFHIATYAAASCKQGETSIGDSYSFGRTKEGSYVTIISDGMGSGADAGKDSRAVVDIIEKFQEAGFNSMTAINTVNSIISMKFDEEEKFSTLDLNTIDLYTGDGVFMKVGAAQSYIKRGKNIEAIKSKTLPIGVLEKPDVDIIQKKFKNGDIIVSISDGIVDLKSKSYSSSWLEDFLQETNISDPKALASEILGKARELSKEKPKDDMTVLVSKVYSIFN